MADTIATSFGVLNYSGMLFNKGNTRTPLSSMIGARARISDSVEFPVGQEYSGGGAGEQPAISETDSLNSPAASVVTRSQKTNVTQIFMESVGVSYAKQSNMGTLSDLNVVGQQENPINELDFQVAAKMQKVNRDIEYTFINGVFNKATTDAEVNKTRGLVPAITTNILDLKETPITAFDVTHLLGLIYESNAPVRDLVLMVDIDTLYQLNADAATNGLTIVSASREVNGISLDTLATPLGDVSICLGECLPAGTALLLNLNVLAPVYQPVPGKGNFFLEPLSRTGGSENYQLFGQIGLDHGPEWYHGKIVNIATGFTAPNFAEKISIANSSKSPVPTSEVVVKEEGV